MVYTFTYTDCAGADHVWTYTYTIDVPELVMPADDGTTVQCPADAVPPTPPTVTDACGNTITPVGGTPTSPSNCDGTMVYTFTHTDCAGADHVWTYTYTIDVPELVMPADDGTTVQCPADAVPPTPPTVTDACGNTITPVAGTPPSPINCDGTMVYTFTYTDCAGADHIWTYTYTIDVPELVMPADDGTTVQCPADAVPPTPPTVTDACGNTITPVAGTPPLPVNCDGTMVYTFTYTDCAGADHVWTYTYTIDVPELVMPADDGTTVQCPADAVPPTPPTVTDACGNTITPVAGTPPSPINCDGTMVYTFTYTDCAGADHIWTYTYTIDVPELVMPADDGTTVQCPADAVPPTPPTVTDACGNTITPVAGTPPLPVNCDGTMVYTFTYTDCAGADHVWTYTYTIDVPELVMPADDGTTVQCPADAVPPTPPTVTDACGNTITPVAGTPPSPINCDGTMVYTFTYSDCSGTPHIWTYTYTIDVPELVMPADDGTTVQCPSDAVPPTPTTVTDACGNTITPTPGTAPTPINCDGTMVYTFTYSDCSGTPHVWTYTYTIDVPELVMLADDGTTVQCPADAVPPTPPTVTDACGNTITPVAGTPHSAIKCDGTM